jgi:hypothetical protein
VKLLANLVNTRQMGMLSWDSPAPCVALLSERHKFFGEGKKVLVLKDVL